jgi:hypothetical protein
MNIGDEKLFNENSPDTNVQCLPDFLTAMAVYRGKS